MSFKISKSLSLPRECISWVISFVAKRGWGKTYCAAVLAEEMLTADVPIIVLDGMGIWWGLRAGKNGEGPGLQIVVFGGKHADLPLQPEKAKEIARAVVESNISAVLDLKEFSKTQGRRIVTAFVDELYRINVQERHIFVEETDQWAPQHPLGPEAAQCLGAMEDLIRRGGNNNIGCTLITQRSAVVNKDLLTQSDCLVVGRTLAPQDKKAIQLWVEEQTDEDRTKLKKWFDSLKRLKNGEAWIWHPEDPDIYKKITFRERETFHATRKFLLSPKAVKVEMTNVAEFVEKFRKVFEPKPLKITTPPAPITRTPEWQEIQARPPIRIEKGIYGIGMPQPGSNGIVPVVSAPIVQRIQQTLPNLVVERLRPNLQVSSEPTSALGKVILVLLAEPNQTRRWMPSHLRKAVAEHQWPIEGVDEAIKQLIQWEFLTPKRRGAVTDLVFEGRDRIQILDQMPTFAVS